MERPRTRDDVPTYVLIPSFIVSELQARGADAHWEADVDHALRAALDSCDVGDWLVVMGAGDIGVRLDALLVERGA